MKKQHRFIFLLLTVLIVSSCGKSQTRDFTSLMVDSLVNKKVDSLIALKQKDLGKLMGTYNSIPNDTIDKYLNSEQYKNKDFYLINIGNSLHAHTNMMDALYSIKNSGFRMTFWNGKLQWEESFKNNERDSLSYGYSEVNNRLKYKEFYRKGKKNGIFLEFYDDGVLKSEAFYQDDRLIDNKIEYYPTRKIKAIGNNYNGIVKEFYPDGQLNYERKYQKGKEIKVNKFYRDISKKNVRISPNIKPKSRLDSLIKNNTDIKVSLLYEYQAKSSDANCISNWQKIYVAPKLSVNDEVSIHFDSRIIIINKTGVAFCDSCTDLNNSEKVEYHFFGASPLIPHSDPAHDTWKQTKIFSQSIGKAYVNSKSADCADTGNHLFSIFRNGKWLKFLNTENIFFFEYDVDKDGFNELYLIDYACCNTRMKIYKLDLK